MGGFALQKEIWAICNTGLGSSLFVEMNIENVLAQHGFSGEYCARHGAVYDIDWQNVFCAVAAADLVPHIAAPCPVIALDSIIDSDELERKLLQMLASDKG